MAVVVSDTSPIRALAHLGLVELLRDLFGDVLVPPAVETELRASPAGLPVVDLGQFPFIHVQAPLDQAILMDEAAGRAMAKQLGLQPVGVLGLLLRGKQRGLIASVVPLLDQLEAELGFFLSAAVRAEARRLASE